MNRLADEHLHLLLDEPVYIIADHGDHPTDEILKDDQPEYDGENKKGICIFAAEANEDDLAFLFKGLNALNIDKPDVAIYKNDYDSLEEYPDHRKRLRFTEHVEMAKAFNVVHSDELTTLNTIPLEEIRNNQEFKRKFWEALKVIFKA